MCMMRTTFHATDPTTIKNLSLTNYCYFFGMEIIVRNKNRGKFRGFLINIVGKHAQFWKNTVF